MAVRPMRRPSASHGREDGDCCYCGGRRDGKKGLFAIYFRSRATRLDGVRDEVEERAPSRTTSTFFPQLNGRWYNLLSYRRLEAKQVCAWGGVEV